MNVLSKMRKRLPGALKKVVSTCWSEASKSGYNAFIVGGNVRDIILGKECKDIDICFEPGKIKHGRISNNNIKLFYGKIARLLKASSFTFYDKFYTFELWLKSGERVDLSLTRSEVYKKPGALPEITPASLKDDLVRRDFTINSIAVGINPEYPGTIVDFFSGLKDLNEKKLRVLNKKSFIDDPTRILRGLRFSARLGFQFEKETAALMRKAIKKKCLNTVSKERVVSELLNGLREQTPSKFLKTTLKYGINYGVFCLEKKITARNAGDIDRPVKPVWRVPVRLSVLLSDYGYQKAKKILKKMGLNRNVTNEITSVLKFLETGCGTGLPRWRGTAKGLPEWSSCFFRIRGIERKWEPVTGHDLIALGLKPGPAFSEILCEINVPGKFLTRNAAMNFIRRNMKTKR